MKLEERYKDRIIFTDIPGKSKVVCFCDTAYNIVTNSWLVQNTEISCLYFDSLITAKKPTIPKSTDKKLILALVDR